MSSEEEPPGWLPDGWIMEIRRGDKGSIFKYYTCPITDYTFRSRKDVMLYLKMVNDGCQEYETLGYVEHEYSQEVIEESVQIVQKIRDLIDWMPRGWIMEIRKQESGEQPDKRYKCYIDQSTGSTFYSKEEALQFLQSGNEGSHAAHLRSSINSDFKAIAEIEYCPNGVPPGWIRENSFRGGNGSSTTRKDPYYLDPVSGFVFRTQKDVALFTEYGIVSKYAFRPRKHGMFDMQRVGSLKPPKAWEVTADGRSFGDEIPKLELITKIDEQLEKTEIPCSNYDSPHRITDRKDNGKRKRDQVAEQENEKPLALLTYSKEKESETIETLFEASDDMSTPLKSFFRKAKKCVSKIRQPNISDDKSSEQSSSALHSLAGGTQLCIKAEAVEEKLQNESHKILSNGHDLDIAKAVTLTENSLKNEKINNSVQGTSNLVVSDVELQGVENETLEKNVLKIEEIATPETKGNLLEETERRKYL